MAWALNYIKHAITLSPLLLKSLSISFFRVPLHVPFSSFKFLLPNILPFYSQHNCHASIHLLLLLALQLHSLNVWTFSTCNFQLLRYWMHLVQFFIFSFFMLFLMSSFHLFFGLPSGRASIGFCLYNSFTILSSGIRCKWPNQLNLCAFM